MAEALKSNTHSVARSVASTATTVASLILFRGFNTTGYTNTVSLLVGFIVTLLGVHLLNDSRTHDAVSCGQFRKRRKEMFYWL